MDPGWVFWNSRLLQKAGGGRENFGRGIYLQPAGYGKERRILFGILSQCFPARILRGRANLPLKNDDGSCRFYGYCSLDQPTWKLDGATCNQEYNSCQTFGNKDGANVSYLEHTISSGGCNAGNAGCLWYCEEAPLVCSGGTKTASPVPAIMIALIQKV